MSFPPLLSLFLSRYSRYSRYKYVKNIVFYCIFGKQSMNQQSRDTVVTARYSALIMRLYRPYRLTCFAVVTLKALVNLPCNDRNGCNDKITAICEGEAWE